MRRPKILLPFLLIALAGCGPSLDDLVDQLARPGHRDAARRELLLAKDRAVDPLLAALEDPEHAASRPELVHVLAGLLMRVGDARIDTALQRHLADDPDPRVRAAVARAVALHRRLSFVEPLLQTGLADADGDVVHQSLLALVAMQETLTPEQQQQLVQAATRLVTHAHVGAATEARILAEARVAELVAQGRAFDVQAEQAQAESLYLAAIDLVPDNKYANYRLARLRFDNGQAQRGLDMLRAHGMLLDVPRLAATPIVDGRLDDPVWDAAVTASGLYSYVRTHNAGIPASVETEIFLGYTAEAFCIGFLGHDEHPDSLVAIAVDDDEDLWYEDIVEIYLDADLDHQSYVHMGVNSLGVKADAWHPNGLGEQDQDWDADVDVAAHVGDTFWSLEVVFRFREPRLPAPGSGDIWGFNLVRTYRGAEYSQWVRTFGDGGHTPDDFGFLVFQ